MVYAHYTSSDTLIPTNRSNVKRKNKQRETAGEGGEGTVGPVKEVALERLGALNYLGRILMESDDDWLEEH